MLVYPWQQKAWQRFNLIYQNGKLPHGFIISAPLHSGLDKFVEAISYAALCQATTKPCGKCRDCVLLAGGSHPDLLSISKEEKETAIKVEYIRQLTNFFTLKSFSGLIKVACIYRADLMNKGSANTFLKILEEPPGNALILLMTPYPDLLPTTIRSRCQLFKVETEINIATLEWVASKTVPGEPEARLALAGNLPLLAIDDVAIEQREAILNEFIQLITGKQAPLKTAKKWHDIGLETVILLLLELFYRIIRCKVAKLPINLSGCSLAVQENLQSYIKSLDLIKLLKIHDMILNKIKLIKSNLHLNSLCILETLAIYFSDSVLLIDRNIYGNQTSNS